MLRTLTLVAAAISLGACSDGLPTGQGGQTARFADASDAQLMSVGARERRPEHNLHFSGQGNSGGIVSHQGGAFMGGLEATVTRGSTPPPNPGMFYAEGHTIEFHNGPLTGIQVSCGTGASLNQHICVTRNAREADIVRQHIGAYGFAAIVTVQGFGTSRTENATVGLHTTRPGGQAGVAGVAPLMPVGLATYGGNFQAGMNFREGSTAFSGNVSGQSQIVANFSTGTVSGEFRTSIGSVSGPVDVVGAFTNAVMTRDGQFHTAAGTGFAFAGQNARGMVEGGIYGPLGQEAVGTMAISNSLGGMTGVFFGTDSRLLQIN